MRAFLSAGSDPFSKIPGKAGIKGISATRIISLPSPSKERNNGGIIAPHAEPAILAKYIWPVLSGMKE